MSVIAALAALSLQAAQPAPSGAAAQASPAAPNAAPSSAPAPNPTPAPPTIDSVLEQETLTEDARQAAVRAAFDAAQARRGALDGRWALSAPDGQALYIFQLTDPGQSPDPRSITPQVPVIEGAWRDPRRAGAADGSGFLARVQRDGSALTIRFADRDPAHPQVVTLHLLADGRWSGALEGEGPSRPVVMARF